MTTATLQTAAAANEYRYASGVSNDYCAAFEVAEWEAEQEAEAEKWEREGRAEMNYTLFGEWEV